MEKNIRQELEQELLGQIQVLNQLELGSKEHAMACESVAKLYRTILEEDKNEADEADKLAQLELEQERYEADAAQKKKESYIKYGLEAAGIALPLSFYAYWMRKGFKFEETGTFTSNTFKNLIQKFKPRK